MKFLMYSQFGEGAGVLKRIQEEGNQVELYVHDKVYKDVYDGLVPKVEKLTPEKDDIIIFDMTGAGKIADQFAAANCKVLCASNLMDKLEDDRLFGLAIMEKCGIKIPDTEQFTKFAEAKEFLANSKKKFVFKPNGSLPCKLTYVANDNEEMTEYLSFVEGRYSKDIDSFLLQEFIEGVVVSSEFWCAGEKGFLHPANHTVEVKKFMNDEKGPSTGCSGNTTWIDEDNIINKGIGKLEKFCKKHNYIGNIDLNTVVNETGVYGLEFTSRFGYDATPTLLTLLETDYGKFFCELADKTIKELSISPNYASSVRFSIPPYPAEMGKGIDPEKFSPNEGVPILRWEEYEKDIYFYEVMKKDEKLVHSSGTGVIGLAMGQGYKVKHSFQTPYGILNGIHIPDLQYRTDLDEVLNKMVSEVRKFS